MSENQEQTKKPTVKCPVCGAEVSNRRIYCPECGANVKSGAPRATASKKPRDENAAAKRSAETPVVDAPTVSNEQAETDEKAGAVKTATPITDEPTVSNEQAETDEKIGIAMSSIPIIDGRNVSNSQENINDQAETAKNSDDDYFDYTPSGERITVGGNSAIGSGADGGKCKKCGADVPKGARFCGVCGAATEQRCANCGRETEPQARYCKYCGALQLSEDIAPSVVTYPQNAKPTAESARRKSLNTASILWMVLGIVIGVISLATDFLTIKIDIGGDDYMLAAQDGLALIGVMFGGRSSLTMVGVPIELLRFAGWLYLAAIITMVAMVVCLIVNSRRNRNAAPFGMLATSAVYLAVGIAVLVISFAAKNSIDQASVPVRLDVATFFMGGIGIFIGAVVAFIGTLVVSIISRKAYEEKTPKKLRVGYYIGLGVVVAVIAALAAVPAFIMYGEKTATPGSSGRGTVRIAETLDDTEYGAEIIKLDGLIIGEEYAFSIRTDDRIDAEFMEDCLVLCYYDEVRDKSVIEIALEAEFIETNQTRGTSTAKLMFTCLEDRPLAIVVTFAAESRTSVGFSYEFEKID